MLTRKSSGGPNATETILGGLTGFRPISLLRRSRRTGADSRQGLAAIPQRDDRVQTVDVHAMRTTFGTLLSKVGIAPRS